MGVEIVNFGLKFSKIGLIPTPKILHFWKALADGYKACNFCGPKFRNQKVSFLKNYAS